MRNVARSQVWNDVKNRLGVKRMPKKVGNKLKRIFTLGNEEGDFGPDIPLHKDMDKNLFISFYWTNTNEGHEYWSRIYDLEWED